MNKNLSDSDESIEHMKLDLLKAKYMHQKLIKPSLPRVKDSKNVTNVTNVIKPKKGNSNPKFSVGRKFSCKEAHNSQSTENNKYQDTSEESNSSENHEHEDIVRMNSHVDYLLDKKRLPLYEDNEDSKLTFSHQMISSQAPTSDGYLKDIDDYTITYNPSTDVLAQWRLRRRLTEAKLSIRSEYEKRSLTINELNSNVTNINSPPDLSTSYKNPYKTPEIYKYDEVPVRDMTCNANLSKVVMVNDTVLKSDYSCQCTLGNEIIMEKEKEKDVKELNDKKETKSRKIHKSKRTVGIMTFSPCTKQLNLRDCCTQTFSSNDHKLTASSESKVWSGQHHENDYIDIAIQKTLQSQLFDRNCNSPLSSITSINDSLSCGTNPQLNIMDLKNDDSDNTLMNGDNLPPWNEDYYIDSDGEFGEDEMLIDLRKRRAFNLEKLRLLSRQIHKNTGTLPALEWS